MSETLFGTRVRVIPPRGLKKLFASRDRRKYAGKVGMIIHVEVGRYSRSGLYYIAFNPDGSDAGVFFESEFEGLD